MTTGIYIGKVTVDYKEHSIGKVAVDYKEHPIDDYWVLRLYSLHLLLIKYDCSFSICAHF